MRFPVSLAGETPALPVVSNSAHPWFEDSLLANPIQGICLR